MALFLPNMFQKGRSLALPVAVSFVGLFFLSGCAGKENNPVHWQQDRVLVLNRLQGMQSASGVLQGQLSQLNIQISTLQTILQKIQTEQGALTLRLQLQDKKINAVQSCQAIKVKEASEREAMPLLKNKKNPTKQLKETPHATADTALPKLLLTTSSNEKKRRKTSAEEKNTYTAAYLAYKSGRFNDAITSFQLLLNDYPEGEYADPGYYWLAESWLAQKQYKKALDVFVFYTSHYSESGKLSAAMLSTARSQLGLQKRKSAKTTLSQLIKRFPASTAADQGRELLATLATK